MAESGTATILFTDLVGSTELFSGLGQLAADELRRRHDTILREAVEAQGGRVVKHLGDGILATFGGAAEAVSAASAIQAGIERSNRRVAQASRLAVRIGVSSGDVMWDDGDCHGTPVVTASRICDSAEGGEILCDDLVRGLARGRTDVTFRLVGETELKGLPEPVTVYEIPWGSATAEEAAPLPGALRSGASEFPFSGRDEERAVLADAWKRAQAEGAAVVLVVGEPGIGKTRLSAEVARAAHAEGALVLLGRCDEHVLATYAPWIEALRHLVAHVDVSVLAGNVERHGGEIARLVPEGLRRVGGDVPAPVDADPETERLLLSDAVVDLFATAAEETPVVFVFDDAHWADSASVSLLRYLVRHLSPDARVLVVVTYRDTDVDRSHALAPALADLRRAPNVTRAVLRGLDESELRAMLERVRGDALPPEGAAMIRRLLEETEGNPFFLQEVLRHLAESGALVQQDGVWVGTVSWDEIGLPEGVRDVVGRRLSALPDRANELLRVAALLGREFDTDVVAEVADHAVDEVVDDLDAVLAAALVEEVEDQPGRLSFIHALVRQTLLEELSTNRKVRLHRRAAEALEQRRGTPVELLAHHFLEAASLGVAEQAIRYATEAAEAAHRRAAFADEVALLDRAVEVSDLAEEPDLALRSELLATLALAEHFNASPDRGRELALAAADAGRRASRPALVARAGISYQGLATQFARPSDELGVEIMREGLAGLGDDDRALQALVTAFVSYALIFAPGDEAYRLARDAVELARAAGDDEALVHALRALAWTENVSTPVDGRAETVAELVAMVERLGDRSLVSISELLLGRVMTCRGDLDAADVAFAASSDIEGASLEGWVIRNFRAARLAAEGRFDDADAISDESHGIAGDIGKSGDAVWHAQRFRTAYDRGNVEACEAEAVALADTPFAKLAPYGALAAELSGDRDRARVEFGAWLEDAVPDLPAHLAYIGVTYSSRLIQVLGDTGCAEQFLPGMRALSGELPASEVTIMESFDTCAARLLVTLGRLDEAIMAAEAGDALHRRTGLDARTAVSSTELGEMLLQRDGPGDRERSEVLLREGAELAERLGMAPTLARARAALEG
ncbi:MAG TPA: AAA family ATPase [Acidimicrobiia bacterium]|nr:AAA family ATPase [Acidimicrobiia bacterium]